MIMSGIYAYGRSVGSVLVPSSSSRPSIVDVAGLDCESSFDSLVLNLRGTRLDQRLDGRVGLVFCVVGVDGYFWYGVSAEQ